MKKIPLFTGPPLGVGMGSAALVLAVMVIPFTSSVAREVLKAVPSTQREAAYALGATRWEAILAALRFGRTGIMGAVMLGFGRAIGETMAVTMVIGNNPQISASLFAPQYTMAAVIANEFSEAANDLYLSALIEIGEYERARALCEKLLSFASPLGLYAEQIDARSGRHLGNFPQAFTHLALINAVIHVIEAETDSVPADASPFVPHATGA